MSEASKRGDDFEKKVAALMRKKLNVAVYRDRRSGAGTTRADITDWFQETPLHIECKSQETIKIKEWWRQADSAASFHQMPALVFAMEQETLVTMRFSDVLDLLLEIAQLKAEIDDLRAPVKTQFNIPTQVFSGNKHTTPVNTVKLSESTSYDKEGHPTDSYGYCLQKGCKYSRGYKPKKQKK